MSQVELMIRSMADELRSLGYIVEDTRDFPDAPYVMNVGKPGIKIDGPYNGTRPLKTVCFSEIEDEPGFLDICTWYNENKYDSKSVNLFDPNSFNFIIKVVEECVVDKFTNVLE